MTVYRDELVRAVARVDAIDGELRAYRREVDELRARLAAPDRSASASASASATAAAAAAGRALAERQQRRALVNGDCLLELFALLNLLQERILCDHVRML